MGTERLGKLTALSDIRGDHTKNTANASLQAMKMLESLATSTTDAGILESIDQSAHKSELARRLLKA